MCVALNYERLYGTSEPGWVERRLAIRLKIADLDQRIETHQISDQEQRAYNERLWVQEEQRDQTDRIANRNVAYQLRQAQKEWDEQEHSTEPRPRKRIWMHPTEPAEVTPPVPIRECATVPRETAPHFIETEIENRARVMVSHNYATLGRRRSRRYEGFR